MKSSIFTALFLVSVLNGCSFINKKIEVQNAIINRTDLVGWTEEDLTGVFGLPENIVPIDSDNSSDNLWIYRDKWYGLMNVRLIDGKVSDVKYQYGTLAR